MSPLQEIIERLEKATGPDRWLDADIHRTVTPGMADTITDFSKGWCIGGNHVTPVKAPAYTASLDAALSLVPEGWLWGVNTFPANEVFSPGGAQAFVHHPDWGDDVELGYEHAEAKTPALALVIAALKARQS